MNGPLERGDRPLFVPDHGSDVEPVDPSSDFPSEESPEFHFLKGPVTPAPPPRAEVDWLSMFPSEASLSREGPSLESEPARWDAGAALPPAPTPTGAGTEKSRRPSWTPVLAAATLLVVGGAGFVASSGVMSRVLSSRTELPPVAQPLIASAPYARIAPVPSTQPIPPSAPPQRDAGRGSAPPAGPSSAPRSAPRGTVAGAPANRTPPRPLDQLAVSSAQTQRPTPPPPAASTSGRPVTNQLTLSPPLPAASGPPRLPPSATVAPPVAPPSAPAASPKPETTSAAPPKAETAVAQVLEEFRQAYGRLDAETVGAIWPSANTKALGRAFDQLENQELTFDNCTISAAGSRAQASCAGKATYVPRVGSKTTHVEPRRWTFRLKKVGDDWFIEAVDAR